MLVTEEGPSGVHLNDGTFFTPHTAKRPLQGPEFAGVGDLRPVKIRGQNPKAAHKIRRVARSTPGFYGQGSG